MDARWVTLHMAKGSFGQVAEALRLGKATALAATDIIFLREGLNFIFFFFEHLHAADQKTGRKNPLVHTLPLAVMC